MLTEFHLSFERTFDFTPQIIYDINNKFGLSVRFVRDGNEVIID